MEVKPEELKRVEHVKLWLCSRLRELRHAKGYTQDEVGQRMGGLIKTRISDFEHCVSDYKFSTVARYAAAIGVPLERVFRGCPGWIQRRVKVDDEAVVIVRQGHLVEKLVSCGVSPAKARSLAKSLAAEEV